MADEEPNGLSSMLADLLRANIQRSTRRTLLLRRACVGIKAADIGLSSTLDLSPGRVEVSNGLAKGRLDLKIRADSATLIQLTTTRSRLGLPDLLHRDGWIILRKLRTKRLRITGGLRHPLLVVRLIKLLSVH